MIAILPTDRKPIDVELWQVSGGDPSVRSRVRPLRNRHDQLDHTNGEFVDEDRVGAGWRKRLEDRGQKTRIVGAIYS